MMHTRADIVATLAAQTPSANCCHKVTFLICIETLDYSIHACYIFLSLCGSLWILFFLPFRIPVLNPGSGKGRCGLRGLVYAHTRTHARTHARIHTHTRTWAGHNVSLQNLNNDANDISGATVSHSSDSLTHTHTHEPTPKETTFTHSHTHTHTHTHKTHDPWVQTRAHTHVDTRPLHTHTY